MKRWMLPAGLALGMIWSVVVSTLMPSWWDPSKDCADRFHAADANIHTDWFPPRATCDFGNGDVRDYITTTQSTLLSITGLLILALILTGLVHTLKTLKGDPGPTHSADGVDLKRRHRNHLLYGALDVLVVVAVLTGLNVAAIIFGEIVGGVLFVLTAVTVLAALATALDRHTGPLPSTALAGRRRGAAIGGILFGVIFGATALTGQLPFFRLWAAPLAAITYAAAVHHQWTRAASLPSRQPSAR